ncbi:hypothetical protein R80B4_03148 [Fibrobacteres bacterium R8-0-B4]
MGKLTPLVEDSFFVVSKPRHLRRLVGMPEGFFVAILRLTLISMSILNSEQTRCLEAVRKGYTVTELVEVPLGVYHLPKRF